MSTRVSSYIRFTGKYLDSYRKILNNIHAWNIHPVFIGNFIKDLLKTGTLQNDNSK